MEKLKAKTKEYNDRVMYLGMRYHGASISYIYVVIEEDLTLGREWSFKSKIYKKGGVGAVNACTLDGNTIHYNKSDVPTYLIAEAPGKLIGTEIKYKDVIQEATVKHQQAEVKKRNAKPNKQKMQYDLEDLRRVYKGLNGNARARFIADVVYKITKT